MGLGHEELAGCDFVIEAIVENEAVKKQVFADLEPRLAETAILTSNTSTIPITKLANGLQRPAQFCGFHFFNPVRRMKLVEVIRGEQTSDETVATAVAHAKRIGKLPIVVNDGPGFLVNRLLLCRFLLSSLLLVSLLLVRFLNESLELLMEGIPVKTIERAAKAFGMPMGPLELYDMVGLDTAVYAGKVIREAFPDRTILSPILPALLKNGRLGKKSGKGFFSYENRKQRAEPDPWFDNFIRQYVREEKSLSQEQVTMRLFLPMLLEATRALEANIVRNVQDVDFGMIYGLGFPPFKGGLLFWADTLGAAQILELLKPLAEYGARTKPTALLEEMAKENRKFYP